MPSPDRGRRGALEEGGGMLPATGKRDGRRREATVASGRGKGAGSKVRKRETRLERGTRWGGCGWEEEGWKY